MSVTSIGVAKRFLERPCQGCFKPFEPKQSFLNRFQKTEDQKVKIVAHKVAHACHSWHPDCFWRSVEEAQREGKWVACLTCRLPLETIDGKSIADPDAVIDNSKEAISRRGRLLLATLKCDIVFGAFSKFHEVQTILAGGEVAPQVLNQAAVLAAEQVEFDCIPLFLAKGPLSLDAKDRVVEIALERFDWPTVELILPLGISEPVQHQALYRLALFGEGKALNALLSQMGKEGHMIPKFLFEEAVIETARRGELFMVQSLLDHQPFLSSEGARKAIYAALKGDGNGEPRREMIQLILEKGRLSGYARALALLQALAHARFDVAFEVAFNLSSLSLK